MARLGRSYTNWPLVGGIILPVATGPVSHAITASGSTATDGAAPINVQRPITAAGTTTTDGAAGIGIPHPVTATGSTTTDGAAAIDLTIGGTSHPITASGSTTTDGAAPINVVRPVTSAGATTSDGTAAINATRPITSVGSTTITATAPINVLRPVTASGAATTNGAAPVNVTRPLTSSGSTTADGTAAIDISNGPISHALSSSGTTTTDGAAGITAQRVVSASGTTVTDGAAPINVTRPISTIGTVGQYTNYVRTTAGHYEWIDGPAVFVLNRRWQRDGYLQTTAAPAWNTYTDPAYDVRVECQRPLQPGPNNERVLNGGLYFEWQPTGALNHTFQADVGFPGVAANNATMDANVAKGAMVQIRATWDPATDTSTLYCRAPGTALDVDTGWTVLNTNVNTGRSKNTTVTSLTMGNGDGGSNPTWGSTYSGVLKGCYLKINTDVVRHWDGSNLPADSATSFTDKVGAGWTIVRNDTVRPQGVRIIPAGTSGYLRTDNTITATGNPIVVERSLASTGSTTCDGTATLTLETTSTAHPITASGTVNCDPANVILSVIRPLTAAGSVSTDGASAPIITKTLATTGTTTTDGGAALQRFKHLASIGVTTTAFTATPQLRHSLGANGWPTVSADVTLRRTCAFSAWASTSTDGTARPSIPRRLVKHWDGSTWVTSQVRKVAWDGQAWIDSQNG